jgi:hypothetical protein
MIKSLQYYSNLGTPNFLSELLDRMDAVEKKDWSFLDLQQLFINQRIDGIENVTGCLKILMHIGILQKVKVDSYIISPDLDSCRTNQKQLSERFIELLFEKLIQDPFFNDIFTNEFISFDSLQKSYVINNKAFGYKYSKLRKLLIDFDFLIEHPNPKLISYLFNNEYKSIIARFSYQDKGGRKISVDDFNKSMEQKRIYGEEAENFVVEFEESRLEEKKSVEWVAKIIVNYGYDIASYDVNTDKELNRFIEVKSYSGSDVYFYLSKNELQISKRKGSSYWLYLVNRDKINNKDYEPLMIQDPYTHVFTSNQWESEAQNWKFQKIS